jgi:hypothetical protein
MDLPIICGARPTLALKLGAVLLVCGACDRLAEPPFVSTDRDGVLELSPSPPRSLPTPKVLAEIASTSPFWRVNQLAVQGDGIIALGHSPSCSVFLHDVTDNTSGEGLFSHRTDVCGRSGRGIADLYWLNRNTFGVFDSWSNEIRTFRSDGTEVETLQVPSPRGSGWVTAAVPHPEGTSVIVAFEPVGAISNRSASKLVQVLPSDSEDAVAFLDAPEIALRDDLRFPFGVELCVRQTARTNGSDKGATVLVGNRWAHEGIVLRMSEPPFVARTRHWDRGPYLVRVGTGRLSPPPGGFGVACGERSAVVHHSRRRGGILGDWVVTGVLDVLDFDTGDLARFDLSDLDGITLTREIGIDGNGRLFSLVRDSATLRLLVFDLKSSGRS